MVRGWWGDFRLRLAQIIGGPGLDDRVESLRLAVAELRQAVSEEREAHETAEYELSLVMDHSRADQQLLDAARTIVHRFGDEERITTCLKKVVYDTKGEAEYAALALYHTDGRFLDAYGCTCCHKWHLTEGTKPGRLVGKRLVWEKYHDRLRVSIGELMKSKEAPSGQ